MTERAFLRSINVQFDVEHPERVSHFRPTTKSVGLVSAIARGRAGNALFVVAPYGSGKSIAAAYAGHLVENSPKASETLERVEGRLVDVDRTMADSIRERRLEDRRGLFVPLYGHVASAPKALQDGIVDSMRRAKLWRQAGPIRRRRISAAADVRRLMELAATKAAECGRDRIVIVWDEFGRHLQGLVSEGRPEELDVLQVLAEVVSRPTPVPVFLALLLHRSLAGYATGLPSGLRKEWAKIEGRFETLQYVDDSTELYEVIGSLVREDRAGAPSGVDFESLAVDAKRVGLFPNVAAERLAPALASAWPLTATTLHLLPRVAARVAQNERTVFSFLQGVPLDGSVRPSALYEYFGGDFQADGGAGGTHRPWLETESALAKTSRKPCEEEALKAAFLLSLGLGGERGRATRDQLIFALEESGDLNALKTLDELVRRNLLVHRRHADQLVVWHGTDVDLRGRLADERTRGTADFELARFLAAEFPPPVWRPVEYNARHGIRRYCTADYVTVGGLARFLEELELDGGLQPGTDGRVLYVLPATEDEEAEARRRAAQARDPRVFVAVAPETGALVDAALDLWHLQRMHADPDLLCTDPLVGAELDQLADDARTGLQPLVDRVVRPQARGSAWFHKGREVTLDSVWALRRLLSETMDDVFPETPVIHSEMVVRRRVSPVISNARKKVALGLLERYGQEDVGIEGGNADRAIFGSVFLRTGLYRFDGERWGFAQPEEIPGGGGGQDSDPYGVGSGAF